MSASAAPYEAFPARGKMRFSWILPLDGDGAFSWRMLAIRLVIAINVLLGFRYLTWRWTSSINWSVWPFGLALVLAETYSFIDTWLFGATMWRLRRRPAPPPPDPNATVDVLITCYNEPVELVRETVRAAKAMRVPHAVHVLDDGANPAMREMAETEGAGYIVRTEDWRGKSRHAKAGNLNNALFQTNGEYLLVLDADQKPGPATLERTLGYFRDPTVALVQTPQWFHNIPNGDPFGSDAPLFYGPIQQGKDGWNAAFFCGSNAILRREALMQIGLRNYVTETERQVRGALRTANRALAASERQLPPDDHRLRAAIDSLRAAVTRAQRGLAAGEPIQSVTYLFQRDVEAINQGIVAEDLAGMRFDLAGIEGIDELLDVADPGARGLTTRDASPLAAIDAVRRLMTGFDLDRDGEAMPVQPLSTISVTEDMATAMRLHAMGWRSVYHDEILVEGLAPEDFPSALQQRLRWAQGTIQVLLRENPLLVRGLSLGQKLMYLATMWSYLSGIFAPIYLISPVLYLFFGLIPVTAYSRDFFGHLLPFLLVNQFFFLVIGWKRKTWRGQQYTLALFPLWIKAAVTAAGSVWFGRKLGFVVTPKTRQAAASLRLVRVQITMMLLLAAAVIYGLARLALGLTSNGSPIMVNVFWAVYELVMLSVVLDALVYAPAASPQSAPARLDERSVAAARGRPASGLG